MSRPAPLDRDAPIDPSRTALLLIDVQKGIFHPGAAEARPYFHKSASEIAVPNMVRLLAAARSSGLEVVHTVIQSLTADGRDRSLDYKLTGFNFPPGSREAEVCDEVAPQGDEMVLPKTSSSLFNSTIFEYLLRNIGLDSVIVTGFLTDQCVDHTVRDGADRGFRMICPIDACTTDSRERHENALAAFRGYCRQATTEELVKEFS
ncbi:cysteine hydrolase family protein [Aquibaculum arenosum]|uniref:Cysteine hydrolase n=1 Tax=Aquibaculum arenosum TaxID=3032591 RepID=A0ABT5YI42_9PROT|nr:isochorismatase family cysteine hydrolase [Fodinicurvata sp. CAU 1616]MDF2094611.1 cysteine hydrolase [Fodinicurvata sp. CAU 1616]